MGVTDSPVVDRGALVASFDPADHPIPTGREEAWRFTPLRSLRGLHDGTRRWRVRSASESTTGDVTIERVTTR